MTVASLPLLAAWPLHMLSQELQQWVYEVDTHGTKPESESVQSPGIQTKDEEEEVDD